MCRMGLELELVRLGQGICDDYPRSQLALARKQAPVVQRCLTLRLLAEDQSLKLF